MEFLVVGDWSWGFSVTAYVDSQGCSIGDHIRRYVYFISNHILFSQVQHSFTLLGKIVGYQLDYFKTVHRHI